MMPKPNHDASWKQFFSLPVAFKHLIDGFYPDVAAVLDLESARPASAEWTHEGRRRLADAVWRVEYADGSGRFLDVVLEFQSTVDAEMASRMKELAKMAFARRIDADDLAPDGLMRLLGVVIHSGAEPWNAPGGARPSLSATDEVVVKGGAYAILRARTGLDGRPIAAEHLPLSNVVSTLCALCGVQQPQDIEAPLRDLAKWLPDLGPAGTPLPGAYADWLAGTTPGVFTPESARRLVAEYLGMGDGNEKEAGGMTALQEAWERDVEQGVQQGVLRGRRDLLNEMATQKYSGAAATRLAEHLAESDDAARLAEARDWILNCATSDELVAHIGNGKPVNGSPRR